MPDLWPDDVGQQTDLDPPIVLLREQAEALPRRTKGLLTASVITKKVADEFVHVFMLEAPALDNYSYELFWVQHPVLLYPVKIVVGEKEYAAADPDEFTKKLRSVLALPEVKRVLQSLRSQAERAES
jgi:hypothetical protein